MNYWLLLLLLVPLLSATEEDPNKRFRLCGTSLPEKIKKVCTPPGFSNQCTHGTNYVPVKRSADLIARARRAAESYEKIADTCCTKGRCSIALITTFCCDNEEMIQFVHAENETYLMQFLKFLRLSLILF